MSKKSKNTADPSFEVEARRRLPSASGLSRAIRCPASNVVGGVREPATYAQERGTLIHKFCELGITKGREFALGWLDHTDAPEEQRALCAKLDFGIFPEGVECEVAMGYDERTHQTNVYHLTGHRDYPSDGLFHGTTDVAGLADAETVYVADIKTGDHEPAKDSWQLRFAALAASVFTAATKARVEMLRILPSGAWARDPHDLSAEDLATARTTLAVLADHVLTATLKDPGPYEVGPHCKFCPALRLCPAQTALARAIEPTLMQYSDDAKLLELEDADVVRVFQRVQRYEDALKAVRMQLEAIVEASGGRVIAEDGRHLILVGQERRYVEDAATEALLAQFGTACSPALSVNVGKLNPVMSSYLYDRNLLTFKSTKPSLKLVKAPA